MRFVEHTIDTERIFDGKVVKLRRDQVTLPDGRVAAREVIEHPGGVGIVALDSAGQILLVRQYRHPFEQELLEIPAGKLEYGENPRTCGVRELEEETGCVAAVFEPLGCLLPTPAYDNETIHLFAAKDLTDTQQHLDPGEFLAVERVPFDRALEMVLCGEIRDAKTQVGIMKMHLLQMRGEW